MDSIEAPLDDDGALYSPLNLDDDEIRLVVLLPREKPGLVKCEIVVVKLSEGPEYEALSYTWDSPQPVKKIYVGDRVQEVHENLFEAWHALQNVRKTLEEDSCLHKDDDAVPRAL